MLTLLASLAVAGPDQGPLLAVGAPPLHDVAYLCDGWMESPDGGATWEIWYSAREWTDLRDAIAATKGEPGAYLFGDGATWSGKPELSVVPADDHAAVPFPGCPASDARNPPPGTKTVIVLLSM
jgi:hypothetical protein